MTRRERQTSSAARWEQVSDNTQQTSYCRSQQSQQTQSRCPLFLNIDFPRLLNRDVPDIRFRFRLAGYPAVFFLSGSGSGSGRNGTRYRISVPDSARSFSAISCECECTVQCILIFKELLCHVDQVFLPLLVVELCSVCEKQNTGHNTFLFITHRKHKN